MSDEQVRRLERSAAAGDPEAQAVLDVWSLRRFGKVVLSEAVTESGGTHLWLVRVSPGHPLSFYRTPYLVSRAELTKPMYRGGPSWAECVYPNHFSVSLVEGFQVGGFPKERALRLVLLLQEGGR